MPVAHAASSDTNTSQCCMPQHLLHFAADGQAYMHMLVRACKSKQPHIRACISPLRHPPAAAPSGAEVASSNTLPSIAEHMLPPRTSALVLPDTGVALPC